MAVLQSAAARTLGINGLLENILVNLSPVGLLHSRRVARSWKENIEGSTALQNKIYPEAEGPKAAWVMSFIVHGSRSLSKKTFGTQIIDCVRYPIPITHRSPLVYVQSACFSRLLLKEVDGKDSQNLVERANNGETLEFTEQVCRVSFCDYRPLSCDNMQFADAPVYDVDVVVECACDETKIHFNWTGHRGGWSGCLGRHDMLRMKDIRHYVAKKCPSPRKVKISFMEAGYDIVGRSQGIVFPNEIEKAWVRRNLRLDL